MILFADFFLHQTETTHNITPDRRFYRRFRTALIVNSDKPLLIEVSARHLNRRVIVCRAREHLFKGEVATGVISVIKRQSLPVWAYHAYGLRYVGEVVLRKRDRRPDYLYQALVFLERNAFNGRQL